LELEQKNWLTLAWAAVRKAFLWPVAQLRKRYAGLKKRYGAGYACALVVVTFVAFFSPIPGTTLTGIALVVVVAEIHRAFSSKRTLPPRITKEAHVMSINCDVVVRARATAEQLTRLGSALWRWCGRAAGDTGIYPYLDNQVMADLIAGKQPMSGQTPRQSEDRPDGIRFSIYDAGSHDRKETINRLRWEIPSEGIADILVDGLSWKVFEPEAQSCENS
jgi:hypothetical protein